MKRQLQGNRECLLCALCNASDTDLKVAKSLFPDRRSTWHTLKDRDPETALSILLAIAPAANVDNLRRSLGIGAGIYGVPVFKISDKHRQLIAATKGIISVRFYDRGGRGRTGHALAYDHGEIVDSNFPEQKITVDILEPWINQYYGAFDGIKHITPL